MAAGDYDPMTLFQMLMTADTVVSGEITRVEAATYDLEVQQSFVPAKTPAVLSVRRIDEAPMASRWTGYASGQEIVLFAKSGDGDNAPLTPLGAAGEGEVPRDGQAVYLPNLAPTDRTPGSAEVAGGIVTGYRVGADEFSAAMEGFFHCFSRVPGKAPAKGPKLERLCDNAELASFRAQSWLAEHLVGISERVIAGNN